MGKLTVKVIYDYYRDIELTLRVQEDVLLNFEKDVTIAKLDSDITDTQMVKILIATKQARQKLNQYYADFYRNKIPKKKQLEGYESPWGWTITDEDKDSKQGWNDCVDTITAQFNRGDNDE